MDLSESASKIMKNKTKSSSKAQFLRKILKFLYLAFTYVTSSGKYKNFKGSGSPKKQPCFYWRIRKPLENNEQYKKPHVKIVSGFQVMVHIILFLICHISSRCSIEQRVKKYYFSPAVVMVPPFNSGLKSTFFPANNYFLSRCSTFYPAVLK